jgi:hypothetical protein
MRRVRCVRLGVRLLKRNGGELTAEDVAGTRVPTTTLDELAVPVGRAALRRSAALEDGTEPDAAANSALRGPAALFGSDG